MASTRQLVLGTARERAQLLLRQVGPEELLRDWQAAEPVASILRLCDDTPSVLRHALDRSLHDLMEGRDAAAGVAATHLVQALTLASLNRQPR